jgi:hypothetical protein
MSKVDMSFGNSAKKMGSRHVLKALVEVWSVVGSFLGLSGGFCFFVVLANPSFQDTVVMSKDTSQGIVAGCLSAAFALSYLGAGWSMTFVGNAAQDGSC